MSDEWVANLKVGDKVVVESHGIVNSFVSTVERFTKTQIIIKHRGGKFRRDGHEIGQWNHSILREPTEERLDAIRQANLANRLKHFDGWREMPLKTLRKIYALLPKTD